MEARGAARQGRFMGVDPAGSVRGLATSFMSCDVVSRLDPKESRS
jgi:hypothetical protein